ncbi:MAG: sporulation protein [Oscillospiraceae bacterium]|jgi:sporulation integral membrane protein YlbJ|nr:sporulation protein [Oscillospiraceae bacterium]
MALAEHRKKIIDVLVLAALTVAVIALVVFPKESVAAAKDGLALCGNVIVPSLFPFFVLSSLIVETGVTRYLGRALEPVMRPLFNVSGSCVAAFALGFIGGYPVGAKTVIALYENGSCTKAEAERLLSFCNNSGPAFIFGVVGAGVFSSGRIGLLLYLAHTLASITVGILFRGWGRRNPRAGSRPASTQRPKGLAAAFTDSVKSSFQSTVNICGFVIFFTVFIKMLFISGAIPSLAALLGRAFDPLGFSEKWAERLLTGFIEISSGVWTLKGVEGQLTGSVAMAAFMLGWAGLSVHSQVLSFIGESGLSVKTYIMGKFLQGVLSAALVFLLSRVTALDVPAAYLAQQVTGIAEIGFRRALIASCTAALALFFLFVMGARVAARQNVK